MNFIHDRYLRKLVAVVVAVAIAADCWIETCSRQSCRCNVSCRECIFPNHVYGQWPRAHAVIKDIQSGEMGRKNAGGGRVDIESEVRRG